MANYENKDGVKVHTINITQRKCSFTPAQALTGFARLQCGESRKNLFKGGD